MVVKYGNEIVPIILALAAVIDTRHICVNSPQTLVRTRIRAFYFSSISQTRAELVNKLILIITGNIRGKLL